MDAPEFIKQMKVKELKEFLKKYDASLTGNKDSLIRRAGNYYNLHGHKEKVENSCDELLKSLTEKRKVFDRNVEWKDISLLKKSDLPVLDDDVISKFLTICDINFGDEEIDCGTEKPAKKGKIMYYSEKIQLCEFALENDLVLFRANMSASMSTSTFR